MKSAAISVEEAFLREFYMRKVLACATALQFLKLAGQAPKQLYGEARRKFIAEIGRRARQDIWPAQVFSCKLLLDWLTPDWGKEDPELFGALADRHSAEYWAWRKAVLRRDGCKCRACGETSGLHAHHIVPWVKSNSLRFEVSNGVTLCADCHVDQHKNMMRQIWATEPASPALIV